VNQGVFPYWTNRVLERLVLGPTGVQLGMPARAGPLKTRRPVRSKAVTMGAAAVRNGTLHPIITMNSEGVIQSASDSIEHVFGWTATELYGRNVKLLIPEPKRSVLDRYLDRYRNADQRA